MSENKEQNTALDAQEAAKEQSSEETVTSVDGVSDAEVIELGQDDSVVGANNAAQGEEEPSQSTDESVSETRPATNAEADEPDDNDRANSSEQESTISSEDSSPASDRLRVDKPSFMDSVFAYLRKIWPQLRRLLILEIKLCLSILRNMLAMPVALIAMLLDLVQEKDGKTENFDKVIDIGVASEDKINLFRMEEETLHDESSVDAILKRAEDKLKDL